MNFHLNLTNNLANVNPITFYDRWAKFVNKTADWHIWWRCQGVAPSQRYILVDDNPLKK
jgi:hypothetical protein